MSIEELEEEIKKEKNLYQKKESRNKIYCVGNPYIYISIQTIWNFNHFKVIGCSLQIEHQENLYSSELDMHSLIELNDFLEKIKKNI